MKVKVHWILDGVAELEADTPEDAEREVNIFFAKDEIINYSKATDSWVVE